MICVTQVTCSTLSRGELEEMFDPNLCSDELFVGSSFPLQTPVKCSNLIYMHGLWEEAGHHAKTRTFFFLYTAPATQTQLNPGSWFAVSVGGLLHALSWLVSGRFSQRTVQWVTPVAAPPKSRPALLCRA